VVGVVLGSPAVLTASLQTPDATLPSKCTDQVVAPQSMLLVCGVRPFAVEQLTWTSWGAARATAAGTARVNTCDPSCAAGNYADYPIQLTADKLTPCKTGRPQYTRVSYTFTAENPFPPDYIEPQAFPCPRPPHDDPRIRDMRLWLTGHNPGHDYFVRVHVKLRICAVRGHAEVKIAETKGAGGHRFAEHARTLNFEQMRACNTRSFRWKLRDEFFGVGTYKVKATVWDKDFQSSRPVSRRQTTLD
jgi:hypothetical protein